MHVLPQSDLTTSDWELQYFRSQIELAIDCVLLGQGVHLNLHVRAPPTGVRNVLAPQDGGEGLYLHHA